MVSVEEEVVRVEGIHWAAGESYPWMADHASVEVSPFLRQTCRLAYRSSFLEGEQTTIEVDMPSPVTLLPVTVLFPEAALLD
jgi:hypothetical protein